MSDLEPEQISEASNNQKRAWLASILLRSQHSWFGRFALQLRRLATLGRGQRRRLERKAAVSLAGAALVLSLGAGLMHPKSVYAASINVDAIAGVGVVVIANDGDCSLPEAIINANNNSQIFGGAGECAAGAGASDTINLPNSALFVLTTVNNTSYYSNNGLPEIDSRITIEGNASEIQRDSAAESFRILAVTTSGNLTLNDTRISYGYSEEDGGGLYVAGTALVQDSTFEYNHAYDDGGAIEVDEGGSLTIDNSTIAANESFNLGGGVSSEDGATLIIRNGTMIRENYAIDGGGGLAADTSGLVTIDASTFLDNSSDYFGGGIATYQTEVVIQNNTIITGNGTDDYGGGADFYLSDVTITDSTISQNYAIFQGGGLHLDGSSVTIEHSTISENKVNLDVFGQFGGGIFSQDQYDYREDVEVYSDLTIIDSTLSGNEAVGGGAIFQFYNNDLEVFNSTINGNTAVYGGGVLNFGGRWNIVNSTLSGNVAAVDDDVDFGLGGAILNFSNPEYDSFLTALVLSTVTGNTAAGAGGGILNSLGNVFLGASLISGNSAEDFGDEVAIEDVSGVSIGSFYSVFGHSGETTAEAFYGFTPDVTDLVLTSDGALPTALGDILQTVLADNGGPTETHALVDDSPAIDHVRSDICTQGTPFGDLDEDQRYRPRDINIPGIGSDTDLLCDAGAYEVQLPSVNMCPVDDPNVGDTLTSAIGIGQGSPTKGFRTRKLTIPNSDDLVGLYGQLAAVETGVMKYVRFLPQGEPKIQIGAPTSAAYRTFAVDWWGSELPTDSNWVKGQFFWGLKGNKSPRAFVLWPTYETNEDYANVFATFDDSATNHVAWEAGFIATQTQTLEIPETQADGATVNVTVALVDVNKDNRSVILTVAAGGESEERVITQPNKGLLLNLEEFELEGVDAGTDEVVITLESPTPSVDFPNGGDSAAMIGATANYACEVEDVAPPAPRPDGAALGLSAESASMWNRIKEAAATRIAPSGDWRTTGLGGRFTQQMDQLQQEGRGQQGRHHSENGRD